ncbi:glycosyl hydrolase 115 family protein [Streptomyces humi]|uniref:glycosyl hydrolase 115 family protein n=1 Tax=Streptomyces humi TaxID=1428620 RepID=UPI00062886D6|nr:glycosyl hydrolase 115 family protein [Streptomyces humi]
MSVSRRTVLGAGAAAVPVLSSGGARGVAEPGLRDADPESAPRITDPGAYISFTGGAFSLVGAPVVVSADDHPGVVRVAADLRADLERVTGIRPGATIAPLAVLVGTIGRSPLIDGLVAAGRLDVTGVRGKWETSLQTVVEHPLPGVAKAFVIAGSDPRGTIFGVYDVSYGIGISPWYWWDDVPPARRTGVWVLPGRFTQGTPAVRYRGFFINDENPALGTWAPAHFGPGKAPGYPGGFNADFYARVFEVLLRLKGNYLWPAVWGRAFAEDDPENHRRAADYGVVMGTSHEAPMMRGIEEWNRHAAGGRDPYGGTGEWSYLRNAEAIRAYWRAGVRRMVDEGFEGVVTLGMRGNGDTGLPDGDGIELMREIIAAQRRIIEEETGRPAAETPQVWTLYKEVQRYWDRGLRAPDDVTVVLTDDNWGNIRKHPSPAEPRGGGYGLYYHFDYVGAGRNYKWVDTANLRNVWDQLHQAHAYGNHGLWVANVGDLKGNELPTEFFLTYAWNPGRWDIDRLGEWERRYARQNFGAEVAGEAAEVLAAYGQLQARRKPELLNRRITLSDTGQVVYDDRQTPFSFGHRELERVTGEWRELGRRAARIARRLPEATQDAWFELVGYEVAATANLYALREAEFTNLLYAGQGRAATNDRAADAEQALLRDFALADRFNSEVAGGKWRGFQTQPHIDYGDVDRYGPNAPWQQPEKDNVALPDVLFPAVRRIEVPEAAGLGVWADGAEDAEGAGAGELPPFSPYQTRPQQFVEVFNRGRTPFDYRVESSVPWLVVDRPRGRVERQVRVEVRVDWSRAPGGRSSGALTVSGAGESVTVRCVAEQPTARGPRGPRGLRGFVEAGGYVVIDAEHHDRVVGRWRRLAGIGRTGAGMTAWPVTGGWGDSAASWPRLEYEVSLLSAGEVTVWAYLSPRNPSLGSPGLHYALSFDDDEPRSVDITAGADDGLLNAVWARNTSDNVNRTATRHTVTAGTHRLKFWSVDPTVVVQRLLIDTGGLTPTYLGPLESRRL